MNGLYLGAALSGRATTGDCLTAFCIGLAVGLILMYLA